MKEKAIMGDHRLHILADDAELVERVRQGETAAYDRLFDRHYQKVYNFALRLAGDRDQAEDIAQTAFIRAYESLGHLLDGQAFLKYLYRIVINQVRDRARQRQRKPLIGFLDLLSKRSAPEDPPEPVEFADRSLDPERLNAQKAQNEALAEAIARLPLEFREPLVLHHLQEMDLKEIAELTGVPEGTVKSRLGRARQRLRETMRPWVEIGGEYE